MPANFKKFDVKHGLSVNGLEFVDENRNVTLNNLTVQGTSTVVDTRTVTAVDPIISLGTSGSTHTITEITIANPGRIKFGADAFDDIAVGDSFQYNSTGTDATPLVSGSIYYVISKETDVTSANYRTITFSGQQGGSASAITAAGSGTQTIILNPLRDLGQDLGIEFNYVESSTAKKGFFGFDDSRGRFTFLLDTTYRGQSTQSDDGVPNAPDFDGTKSGAEFSYAKLEPSSALTSSQSALDIDQTWNGGGTFKAIEVDIADTNSGAPSSLLDLSVDNNTKLELRKDGAMLLNTGTYAGMLSIDKGSSSETTLINAIATWNAGGSTFKGINLDITSTAYAFGSKLLQISTNSAGDFDIDVTGEINSSQIWNAADQPFIGIDLQVTDTASAAASKLVNFYSTADRYFAIGRHGAIDSEIELRAGSSTVQTAVKVNVTDTASAANSLLLDLQVGDASKFSVDKDGDINAEGDFNVNGSGRFDDRVIIQSQTNDAGNYADSTEFRSDTSTVAAGATAATTVTSFVAATFTSAEVLAQVKQGSNIHTSKLLLIHDGTDVWLTEYGTVYNSDILVTFDAIVSGGNVLIQATNTAASASANAVTTVKSLTTSMNA